MGIKLELDIDRDLWDNAQVHIENIGLDFGMVVELLCKRVCKEESLGFLLAKSDKINESEQEDFAMPHSVVADKVNWHSCMKGRVPDNFVSFPDSEPHANLNFGIGGLVTNARGDMTKSKALTLFRAKGIVFNKNITYASKNKSAYNYWSNPCFDMLEQDWYIILNDYHKKKLYLFVVPSGAIDKDDLVSRADKRHFIDLQIRYDDKTFTDNRSDKSFAEFKVGEIEY